MSKRLIVKERTVELSEVEVLIGQSTEGTLRQVDRQGTVAGRALISNRGSGSLAGGDVDKLYSLAAMGAVVVDGRVQGNNLVSVRMNGAASAGSVVLEEPGSADREL